MSRESAQQEAENLLHNFALAFYNWANYTATLDSVETYLRNQLERLRKECEEFLVKGMLS